MRVAVIIFSLLSLCNSTYAQDQSNESTTKHHDDYVRYKLLINPMELFVQNISVTAERVFKKRTIGFTLAFKPAIQNSGDISAPTGLFGDYKYNNAVNHVYNAVSAGINSKRYFHPARRSNIYLDAQFLYRYWWFNNKDVSYPNVEGYRFSAMRTEKANVYDGKILFGCSLMGRRHHKTKAVVDFFGGLDVRYKTWKYDTYNGTVMNTYYAYLKESGSYWMGNPYIGLQFGLGR